MAMTRDAAKTFVLGEFKKAIQKRNGDIAIDDDKWAGDPVAEAIASLVDYIMANGVVNVSGAVDPATHSGTMTGKVT